MANENFVALGKIAMKPKGDWETGQTYKELDIVTFNNASYIATEETNSTPGVQGAPWMLLNDNNNVVRFNEPQSLTNEEKAQARTNIGAAFATDVTNIDARVNTLSSNAIRHDVQTLTDAQKAQARENIKAALENKYHSENVLDLTRTDLIVEGKALNDQGNLYNAPTYCVVKIPVNGIDNNRYQVYGLNTDKNAYVVKTTRAAMYDSEGNKLGLIIGASGNSAEPAVISNENCAYLYMHILKEYIDDGTAMVLRNANTQAAPSKTTLQSYNFIPYNNKVIPLTQWNKKTWAAYGDSITAISNGNYSGAGWARYVNAIHGFSNFYGRGVGSQTYKWREHGGNAVFINSDGTYNSRDNSKTKDNYSGTPPTGTTVTRGAFCSWLRITTMFPTSIKDNIDMIFIMGGTNDADDTTELAWIDNDDTDTEWAASEFYEIYGGDYNIESLKGAVASTIMKFQAWMPNAIIVIGTPLNGQTNSQGFEGANKIRPGYIPDEYSKSNHIIEVARMFGCPVIDVYGTCNINVLNSSTYITDGTHPYSTSGIMMLGRAVAGGLNNIYPRLDEI